MNGRYRTGCQMTARLQRRLAFLLFDAIKAALARPPANRQFSVPSSTEPDLAPDSVVSHRQVTLVHLSGKAQCSTG